MTMELMHLPTIPEGCEPPWGWYRKEWKLAGLTYIFVLNRTKPFKACAQVSPKRRNYYRRTPIGQYEMFYWVRPSVDLSCFDITIEEA
jgi:hypothetical protein